MTKVSTYETLYEMAVQFADSSYLFSFVPDEEVNRQAAELVTSCQSVSPEDLKQLESARSLINYADATDQRDWDRRTLHRFVKGLLSDFHQSPKQYVYRPSKEGPDGDSWEVVGVHLDGFEDWVAYVSTETVALNLIAVLDNPSLVQEVSNAA